MLFGSDSAMASDAFPGASRAATCAAHNQQYAGQSLPLQGPLAAPAGVARRSRSRRHGLGVARRPVYSWLAVSQEATSSLSIRLDASPRLVAVLAALHLGAVPCALTNNLPLAVQGLLVAGVLLGAAHCIAVHGTRRAPRSVVRLIWDGHGRWRLLRRDGTLLEARLVPGAYVHPKLVILPFRTRSGVRRSVLVVADRAPGDDLRRLRVRLRCGLSREP